MPGPPIGLVVEGFGQGEVSPPPLDRCGRGRKGRAHERMPEGDGTGGEFDQPHFDGGGEDGGIQGRTAGPRGPLRAGLKHASLKGTGTFTETQNLNYLGVGTGSITLVGAMHTD